MPGLDGTGPRGAGPMTGGGGGFCVLKLPGRAGEPITGLVGRVGWPVGWQLGPEAELSRLRSQARQIEAVLHIIRRRIEVLEANRQQVSAGV